MNIRLEFRHRWTIIRNKNRRMPGLVGTGTHHCFICFNEVVDITDATSGCSDDEDETASGMEIVQTCKRFRTLVSRYLGVAPAEGLQGYNRNEHNPKEFLEVCCDDCIPMIVSFCQIYGELQYLTLQLNWRLEEISGVMRTVDQAPQNWRVGAGKVDGDFRSKLMRKGKQWRK